MPIAKKHSMRPAKKREQDHNLWPDDEDFTMLLYGRSSSGKTTFWSSFPRPIRAIICSGREKSGELRSIAKRDREGIYPFRLNSIEDFEQAIDGEYATWVLDHASGLQDLCLKEVLGVDTIPEKKDWGMASGDNWQQVNRQTIEILRRLLNLSGRVVIVAQERDFGGREDQTSEILTPMIGAGCTPGVHTWLAPTVDYMVQTFVRPKMVRVKVKTAGKVLEKEKRKEGEVEYCLRTGRHDVFYTKFRVPKTQHLPDCIVDPDYGKVIALINGERT